MSEKRIGNLIFKNKEFIEMNKKIINKTKALFSEDVEAIIISKDDYDRLCGELTYQNIKYKEVLDKIKPMLKDLNIKLKDILNIGIDIKEIGDILELLEEIE